MTRQHEFINSKNELAENLRDIREDHDLTQREIASVIHCARSTYAYYETAKTNPSVFTLIKLAEFYDIDIRYFLFQWGKYK